MAPITLLLMNSARRMLRWTCGMACCLSFAVGNPPSVVTRSDEDLIAILLEERLDRRTFAFRSVIQAASGRRVLPYQENHPVHQRVRNEVERAVAAAMTTLQHKDSPLRSLRRIHEASLYFENELRAQLGKADGLRCEVAKQRDGHAIRVGYPDLQVVDVASGLVFYLDPKLVEKGSHGSSFRTFYYEPRQNGGKITHDAVHLLIGIEHDGNVGQWTFTGWRLVDLSGTRLRLKAEFQASNSEIYGKTELSSSPADE